MKQEIHLRRFGLSLVAAWMVFYLLLLPILFVMNGEQTIPVGISLPTWCATLWIIMRYSRNYWTKEHNDERDSQS